MEKGTINNYIISIPLGSEHKEEDVSSSLDIRTFFLAPKFAVDDCLGYLQHDVTNVVKEQHH